jgi:hypothetical protein
MRQFFTRKRNKNKNRERGVALFMALIALLLLAAIAAGMMFMANTESTINYNYRDAQFTYFAANAGLEDAREAMRTDDKYLPQNAPAPGNLQGVIYILNPAGTETVAPWDPQNPYFDDEFCHSYNSTNSAFTAIQDPGVNVRCDPATPIPSNAYTSIPASQIRVNGNALSGSKSALAYKWVRISLKLNNSLVPAGTTGYQVDNTQGAQNIVCWGNQEGHEFIINTDNRLPSNMPKQYPSEFELAALQKAIDMGVGTPAVMMFGGLGKGTTTGGNGNANGNGNGSTTTTGSTTSTTTGSTTSTTTGSTTSTTTSGSTTGSTTSTTTGSTTSTTTSGSTTGTTSTTTSGSTTGTTSTTTSGSTTGTTSTTTSGSTSGSTTGTTTTGSSSGSTSGSTTGTTGGTTTGTPVGPGYYQLVDKCNQSNKYRYSVYLVTSMAAGRNGTKRMTQFEISRASFPGVPGGLTFNGPGATFAPPSSSNYTIDGHDHAQKDLAPGDPGYVAGVPAGKCPGPNKVGVHAITAFGASEATSVASSITSYPDHYTGLGSDTGEDFNDNGNIDSPSEEFRDSAGNLLPTLSPDVVDGASVDPRTGQVPLQGLTTVKENTDLVDSLTSSADLLVNGDVNSLSDIKSRNSACSTAPMGSSDPTVYQNPATSACYGPKITVINGNAKISNAGGTGILLVTGNLELSGNLNWNGLVLVIGNGNLTLSGGGNKTINGGIYVATTKNSSGPLATLGSPNVNYNGGGTSALNYDSCKIAQAVGNQSFRVITYREMSY